MAARWRGRLRLHSAAARAGVGRLGRAHPGPCRKELEALVARPNRVRGRSPPVVRATPPPERQRQSDRSLKHVSFDGGRCYFSAGRRLVLTRSTNSQAANTYTKGKK